MRKISARGEIEPIKSQLLVEAENLMGKLQKKRFIETIRKIKKMRQINEDATFPKRGHSKKRHNTKKKSNKIIYVL